VVSRVPFCVIPEDLVGPPDLSRDGSIRIYETLATPQFSGQALGEGDRRPGEGSD